MLHLGCATLNGPPPAPRRTASWRHFLRLALFDLYARPSTSSSVSSSLSRSVSRSLRPEPSRFHSMIAALTEVAGAQRGLDWPGEQPACCTARNWLPGDRPGVRRSPGTRGGPGPGPGQPAGLVAPYRPGRGGRVQLHQAVPRRWPGRRRLSAGNNRSRTKNSAASDSSRPLVDRCARRPHGQNSERSMHHPVDIDIAFERVQPGWPTSRASMSTRSKLRPRTKNRHASSLRHRGVGQARPKSAARSRTKRKKAVDPKSLRPMAHLDWTARCRWR